MRVLHTSDWHLGRHLHGTSMAGAQEAFVDHLVATVRSERVDLVLHSGDVYDRSQPPVGCLTLLGDALVRLRDAGATVVMISGNHDAAPRLGDKAALLDSAVRIRTDPSTVAEPVLLEDDHGPVAVYAVPYLEPSAVSHLLPEAPRVGKSTAESPLAAGGHARVMARAAAAVHRDRRRRGGRSLLLAHAWVTGAAPSDSERDITVGGLATVPAALFDGIDYTALGHLHRPQALSDALRYAGSPLAYSFGEAGQAKTSWLVELDAAGLHQVHAVPTPVHRELSAVSGELAELMTSVRYTGLEEHFLAVTLTDPVRPPDAMATLQKRYPHTLTLTWTPPLSGTDERTYQQRTVGRSELEIAAGFVEHVRSQPTERELESLREALDAARLQEPAVA